MSSRNASSGIGTIDTGSSPKPSSYIGRFAPSPTGPLHFGSLLAAVASNLEARRQGGDWLVRIEDIDPPREEPGSTDKILAALEHFGLEWDGPVTYQSQSRRAHEEAIESLVTSDKAYRCSCSRRDLADAPRGPLGTIYPGNCRAARIDSESALRVLTDDAPLVFEDHLQGRQEQRLESESGDFIILRRDGLIAYQLAVVVDDHLQGITDIIRGIDLMDSTPRQIWLQRLLGYDTPNYCHIPVAVNEQGQKLSKSHGAMGVSLDNATAVLVEALEMLGQNPPAELISTTIADVWSWAYESWSIDVLRGISQIEPRSGVLDRA